MFTSNWMPCDATSLTMLTFQNSRITSHIDDLRLNNKMHSNDHKGQLIAQTRWVGAVIMSFTTSSVFWKKQKRKEKKKSCSQSKKEAEMIWAWITGSGTLLWVYRVNTLDTFSECTALHSGLCTWQQTHWQQNVLKSIWLKKKMVSLPVHPPGSNSSYLCRLSTWRRSYHRAKIRLAHKQSDLDKAGMIYDLTLG